MGSQSRSYSLLSLILGGGLAFFAAVMPFGIVSAVSACASVGLLQAAPVLKERSVVARAVPWVLWVFCLAKPDRVVTLGSLEIQPTNPVLWALRCATFALMLIVFWWPRGPVATNSAGQEKPPLAS